MRYFIDTEFLEGPQKTLFGHTKPTIDLISIGIVAEDGREYYAISKDFNLKEAWNRYDIKKDFGKPQGLGDTNVYWIRDNVLKNLFYNQRFGYFNTFDKFRECQNLINRFGKTKAQITADVKEFVGFPNFFPKNRYMRESVTSTHPEFYGYYSDYDWVALCWLFGRMIDLPKGFPMYCRDLKQMLDEKYTLQIRKYEHLTRLEAWLKDVKLYPGYPKQENEHNALSDARWNRDLYNFLQKVDGLQPVFETGTKDNRP